MILSGLAETILRWVLSCAFAIIVLCGSGYFFYNGFHEIVDRFQGDYLHSSYLMGIVVLAFGVVILIIGALLVGITNPVLCNYIIVPAPPTV